MTLIRTRVGIVGAGPAGLLLSHLLARSGIESIVLDSRTRAEIETTVRAGILEQGTVEVLAESGASTRALSEGDRHDGIELRITDTGLDPEGESVLAVSGAGAGLRGMRERVQEIGGRFRIESRQQAGEGTTLVIELPRSTAGAL